MRERELLSSPPSSVYISYNFIFYLCQCASEHQQLQFLEQTYASQPEQLTSMKFSTSIPNLDCSQENDTGASEESYSKQQFLN